MTQQSFGSKVRSGVIWSLIQNWGSRVGGLLVFMLLARLLSPAEMGIFAAATTVIAFCALFVDSGLSEAVVQTRDISQKQISSVFAINLLLSIAVLTAIWFSAPAIAKYLNLGELTSILRISAFTLIFNALAFSQMAVLRRGFQYKQLALITLGGTFISGMVAIGMALLGWGVWSLVAQSLIAACYTAIALWIKPAWPLSIAFDFRSVSNLVSYGFKRLLTALMDFANTRFIELFFAAAFGAATLGLYAVGARVYQILMQILCSSILDIAHNAFSRLAHEPEKLREAYYSSLGLAAATSMPIFFMLSMVSTELIVGFFGTQWKDAGDVLRPLLILGGIQVLQFFNGIVYNAIGRPGIGLAFMVGKTIITMASLYTAKDLPFEQVIWAYFASQIVTTPISFWVAKRVVGISFRRVAREVGPFVIALLTGLAAMEVLRQYWSFGIPIAYMTLLLLCGSSVFIMASLVLDRHRVFRIIAMLRVRKVESI